MSPTEPRQLAFQVLERVDAGGFCDALVGETLARAALAPRDAALFTRLAYGALVWRARLDWTIAGVSGRAIERIDAPLRNALRLGLLQITRLDRIPAHAAVHTSVELARRARGAAAAGFVNAVLRAALRRGGELPPPPRAEGLPRALAIETSHPEWLVERWIAELGLERAERLLAANNEPAPTALRIDPRVRSRAAALAELADLGVAARAAAYAPLAVVVEQGARAALDLGWATPQGEASQLVAALVAAAPGERIADLCAAPGGKATALAEAIGDRGAVIAADRARAGARRVRAAAARGGGRAIATLRADAARPPLAPASFDAVLVDAPCSGLGTLRSHPEIRWRRSPADLESLAAAQRGLLAGAARLVRPGGRLVYATCTIAAIENDDVVASFLSAHPDYRREDARAHLPTAAAELVDRDGALRTAPDAGGLDGFYAVRLARSARA